MTPTLDHAERRAEGCQCTVYVLCGHCYGKLARHRAERQLEEWLREFGTEKRTAERGEPHLRIVR